ncbi:hypothetical protein EG68_00960 [Paragonimus skrjabini miyazakii]|uniref:Uncharacterized protein n=1 Tax=Paragonimus skrjabini miyazakii TaxID=59628 RepID=A0A8S9Z8K8_9TREM|nr:hypothetical protein EG68_00960 [Paragonimus skrjabini miyazakii]
MPGYNALIMFIVVSLYQSTTGGWNMKPNSVNPLENSTSVFVEAVAYMNKQPLPWDKKYSDSSSRQFKLLNGSICLTTHLAISADKRLSTCWIDCTLKSATKGSTIVKSAIFFDKQRMAKEHVDYKSEAFMRNISLLLSNFSERGSTKNIPYAGQIKSVTANAPDIRGAYWTMVVIGAVANKVRIF